MSSSRGGVVLVFFWDMVVDNCGGEVVCGSR